MRKYPCIRTYNAFSILPTGDVRVCGCRLIDTEIDDMIVGNIFQKSLKDIINNEKVQEIRAGFEKGQFANICKNCLFYEPVYKYNQ